MCVMGADYQIRSVVRALDVLIAASEHGPADLATLARVVQLHPSTTLRMLQSLRSRDPVRQRRCRYEIGARAFEVGSAFLNGISLSTEAQLLPALRLSRDRVPAVAEHVMATAERARKSGRSSVTTCTHTPISSGRRT